MNNIIVTNNKLVIKDNSSSVVVEGEYLDVLYKVRDLVHANYKLISHPLGASIRMMYSPVKTILLEQGESLDENSVEIIETSIEKYIITMGSRLVDKKNRNDYEVIDRDLFISMMEEHKNLNSRFSIV